MGFLFPFLSSLAMRLHCLTDWVEQTFSLNLGVAMWLDSANEMWTSVMLADALWFCLAAWFLPSAIKRTCLGWRWPCGDTWSRPELHLWLGVKPSWSQQSQGAWGPWATKGTFVLSHEDLEIVTQQNYLHVSWWIFNKKKENLLNALIVGKRYFTHTTRQEIHLTT